MKMFGVNEVLSQKRWWRRYNADTTAADMT